MSLQVKPNPMREVPSNIMDLKSLLQNYQTVDADQESIRQRFLSFIELNPECISDDHPPRKGREVVSDVGHVTASAWMLSPDQSKVLLTHHRKLKKWLQLGGHTDWGEYVLEAALREVKEESGIQQISIVSKNIFDLDIHWIPESQKRQGHNHYDIRFLFKAENENFHMSEESMDLKWFSREEILESIEEKSLLRMYDKWNCI